MIFVIYCLISQHYKKLGYIRRRCIFQALRLSSPNSSISQRYPWTIQKAERNQPTKQWHNPLKYVHLETDWKDGFSSKHKCNFIYPLPFPSKQKIVKNPSSMGSFAEEMHESFTDTFNSVPPCHSMPSLWIHFQICHWPCKSYIHFTFPPQIWPSVVQ